MSQHYLTAIKRGKKLQHCELCIHEHLYIPETHGFVTLLGFVTVQVKCQLGHLQRLRISTEYP